MIQILIGSLMLSIIHALIPNHWIPFVAIGTTEKWSRNETLVVTAIAGIAHTASTVLIGIIVGIVGYKLSSAYEYIIHVIAPVILVCLGFVYLIFDLKHSHQHIQLKIDPPGSGRTKFTIVTSLVTAMFLSPCIEIEAYYFVASALGWLGILTVSVVYFVVTVLGMVILVYFSLKGIENLKWNLLEHHEKKVTGLVLVFLGVFTYLIQL